MPHWAGVSGGFCLSSEFSCSSLDLSSFPGLLLSADAPLASRTNPIGLSSEGNPPALGESVLVSTQLFGAKFSRSIPTAQRVPSAVSSSSLSTAGKVSDPVGCAMMYIQPGYSHGWVCGVMIVIDVQVYKG